MASRVTGYGADVELDDRIARTPPATIAGAGTLLAVVAGAATWWTPLVLDLALVPIVVGALAGAGWGLARRRSLFTLPLEIAPTAARREDGRLQVRVWLGRGRVMRDVRLVVTEGGRSERVGAAGPVVGPWTGVVRVPGERVQVQATCTSGGRQWDASREVEVTAGRYATPVTGSPGSLGWARECWGLVEAP
jgi:hypothetical protein